MQDVTCHQCSTTFQRHPYYIAKYEKLFCSSACYADHRRVGGLDPKGYAVTSINGKKRKAHRLAVEAVLGRKLLDSEDVHHDNGRKSDNRLENLVVVDHLEHSIHHNQLRWSPEDAIKLISDGMSLRAAAAKLGVSRPCMAKGLRKRGLLA